MSRQLQRGRGAQEAGAETIELYRKGFGTLYEHTGDVHGEEHIVTHMNLAMARLVSGDFADDLAQYEWWHRSTNPSRVRSYPQPCCGANR